ncbi:hypothetical protein LTR97_002980 [Elasticomyces elasticus]|uniref:Uncharacterized protein n=1 Tax=Elasticomyces elasticus TaxID=574655 RepID=A0AAN7W9E4_9PEZI|nr:hypothetical protein LTR97_002980 [Elasticomyces elasticus]
MSDRSTLLPLLDYPPYEKDVDVRIPQHFDKDREHRSRNYYDPEDPIYVRSEELAADAENILKAGRLDGYMDLMFSRFYNPSTQRMEDGPLFFAVVVAQEHLSYWSSVDVQLRELVKISYEDIERFQDPPIRWFAEINVIDFGCNDYDEQDVLNSPIEV